MVEILFSNTLRDKERTFLTDKRTVMDKWKALCDRYELKPYVSKGRAFAKLFNVTWDPTKEKGEAFLYRLTRMRLELATMGRQISDEDMGDAIVNASEDMIPNFLDNYTTEDVSLKVVTDTFLRCAEKVEKKLAAKLALQQQSATILATVQPSSKKNNKKGKNKKSKKETRTCYNCKVVGHLSRNCPQPRNEQNGGPTKKLKTNQDQLASQVTRKCGDAERWCFCRPLSDSFGISWNDQWW